MSSNLENDPICSNPPRNADMDGVAVAIGNIIVHWCLRIMVTYSDGDVDLAIQSLLVQFYPVLLSTLLSVRRQQLSLFDADFALLLGSSPLAMYLSFASVCDLCGIRTGLFKRIKSYRRTIRIIGALTPLLWIALSMIASFSNEAFLDSPCNPTLNFLAWLWTAFSPLLSVGRGNPPAVGLGALIPFFILLFRRRSQVWADVKLSLDEASRLRILFTWVKCAWCTIDRRHRWSVHLFFVYIDIMWSLSVVEATFAFTMDGEKYVLSYGQLLSIFFILPTLVSTIGFLYSTGLRSLLQPLTEHGFRAEARYLFTGKEPNPPIEGGHLPSSIVSHPEEQTVSNQSDKMAVSVLPTRQPLRRATVV